MATFVQDSFSGTTGGNLTAHTGEVGATWTEHPDYGDNAVISADNRCRSGGTDVCDFASGVPASPEYDVSADLVCVSVPSDDRATGVCGRVSTSLDTMYAARHRHEEGILILPDTNVWELLKIVEGSVTVLGSFDQTLSAGTTYALTLEIRDAAKKLFVNGVERISSADNAITAAGRVGVRFDGSASDSIGYHLDNLSAVDPPNESGVGTAEFSFLLAGGGGSLGGSQSQAAFTFSADGLGGSEAGGISASEFQFQAVGLGASQSGSTGTAAFEFAADGTGAAIASGTGSAEFMFIVTPASQGTGSASFSFTAVAVGGATAAASGMASFSFTVMAFSIGPIHACLEVVTIKRAGINAASLVRPTIEAAVMCRSYLEAVAVIC